MARTHRDPSLGRNVAQEPATAAPPTVVMMGETEDPAPVVETVTQPVPERVVEQAPLPATWGVPRDQLPPWNPTWNAPTIRGIAFPASLRAGAPTEAQAAPNPMTGQGNTEFQEPREY